MFLGALSGGGDQGLVPVHTHTWIPENYWVWVQVFTYLNTSYWSDHILGHTRIPHGTPYWSAHVLGPYPNTPYWSDHVLGPYLNTPYWSRFISGMNSDISLAPNEAYFSVMPRKKINVCSFFRMFYLCLSCFGIIISGKVQKQLARGRNDQKAFMTYD